MLVVPHGQRALRGDVGRAVRAHGGHEPERLLPDDALHVVIESHGPSFGWRIGPPTVPQRPSVALPYAPAMSLPPPAPDRTCIITGASSGIGSDLARQLARRRSRRHARRPAGGAPAGARRGAVGHPRRARRRHRLRPQRRGRPQRPRRLRREAGPHRRHPGQQRRVLHLGTDPPERPRPRGGDDPHRRRGRGAPVQHLRARDGGAGPRRGAQRRLGGGLPAAAGPGRLRRRQGVRAVVLPRAGRRGAQARA